MDYRNNQVFAYFSWHSCFSFIFNIHLFFLNLVRIYYVRCSEIIIKIYQMITEREGTNSTNVNKTETTTNFILSLH